MNKAEILVIDDEAEIRSLLGIALESNDYRVRMAENARQGLAESASHPPDLILLDLGLPDRSGQELLMDLRKWYHKPIIILSVRNSESDIVRALDNGASDYLCKPFRIGELLARIRSNLRRSDSIVDSNSIVRFGEIQIDLASRTVMIGAEEIKLTATEFNLLSLLARNEGKVLVHNYILKEIWGVGFQTETQYLRVFIASLRKKIELNPNKPQHIITLNGIGYRFQ